MTVLLFTIAWPSAQYLPAAGEDGYRRARLCDHVLLVHGERRPRDAGRLGGRVRACAARGWR